MTDSVYAPPKANVEVDHTESSEFYVVAPKKFFLMTLTTLGFYLVYWFYRNWSAVKRHTGENIWPPMRGLFYIFFTHSLFRRVDETLQAKGKSMNWQPRSLATLVVVLTILTNVLDRMGAVVGLEDTFFAVALALVPVLAVVMMSAQRAINVASEDESGASNARLTLANWAWMAFGTLIWLGVIASLLLPPVE